MAASEQTTPGDGISPATQRIPRSPWPIGGGVLLGAGIVVFASLLTWFTVTDPETSLEYSATDFAIGVGTDAFLVVVALLGIVMLARARKKGGRMWSIAVLVLSAMTLILILQATFSPEQVLPTWFAPGTAEEWGVSEEEAEAALEEGFADGTLSATSGIGAYLALAGNLLVTAAAILGIVWAKRFRKVVSLSPAPPPPPPPPPPPQPPVSGSS